MAVFQATLNNNARAGYLIGFGAILAEIIYCAAGRPYPNDPATTPYLHVRADIWPRVADPFHEGAK